MYGVGWYWAGNLSNKTNAAETKIHYYCCSSIAHRTWWMLSTQKLIWKLLINVLHGSLSVTPTFLDWVTFLCSTIYRQLHRNLCTGRISHLLYRTNIYTWYNYFSFINNGPHELVGIADSLRIQKLSNLFFCDIFKI